MQMATRNQTLYCYMSSPANFYLHFTLHSKKKLASTKYQVCFYNYVFLLHNNWINNKPDYEHTCNDL